MESCHDSMPSDGIRDEYRTSSPSPVPSVDLPATASAFEERHVAWGFHMECSSDCLSRVAPIGPFKDDIADGCGSLTTVRSQPTTKRPEQLAPARPQPLDALSDDGGISRKNGQMKLIRKRRLQEEYRSRQNDLHHRLAVLLHLPLSTDREVLLHTITQRIHQYVAATSNTPNSLQGQGSAVEIEAQDANLLVIHTSRATGTNGV